MATEHIAPTLPTWWNKFILNICELPDHTSPDDEPAVMLATADELESCALRAMEPVLSESPADVRKPHDSWTWHCEAWGESDRPIVALVPDITGVRKFFEENWFGEECIELAEVMEEIEAHDFHEEGDWKHDFEIGGVELRRVYWQQLGAPTASKKVKA